MDHEFQIQARRGSDVPEQRPGAVSRPVPPDAPGRVWDEIRAAAATVRGSDYAGFAALMVILFGSLFGWR